jgi:hypothetical protein
MLNTIVDEKGLLEALPVINRRLLARLRRERKVPFLKLGYHTVLYDTERVIEALKKLEVSS